MNSNKYMMLDSKTMEIKEIKKEYESTYEMLKDGVGGWIEHILIGALGERGIDIWINEEGKLINLPETVAITDEDGKILDVLCGNLVFTRTDDEGETAREIGLAVIRAVSVRAVNPDTVFLERVDTRGEI